jgi:hypothetical protein
MGRVPSGIRDASSNISPIPIHGCAPTARTGRRRKRLAASGERFLAPREMTRLHIESGSDSEPAKRSSQLVFHFKNHQSSLDNGCRFSFALRSSPIQPFLLPLNSLFKERIPFIVYVCASGVEHCLCTFDVPPHVMLPSGLSRRGNN